MKILVSGSRGFIGSVLTVRGLEAGHKMVGLDDFSRGLNDAPSINWDCRQGISHILDEFTYNTNEAPFDAVVHLAAATGSLDRPFDELCELNIEMTKKVYFDAVEHKVPVFVFPTTSLIEGAPDAPYVKSKQQAMDWLLSRDDGIRKVCLQFYNVSGGYNNFSEIRKKEVHIIPIMLECFMKNKTFIINGDDYGDTIDGTPGRDFSNVCDVTDFILHMIKTQLASPFKTGGVIKVGTGVITTTMQMINMFNELIGSTLKYEFGPRRAHDCGWLRCDQPYLHVFRPPIDVKQSLKQEIDIITRMVYDS